jgi:MoxR-like ATPase
VFSIQLTDFTKGSDITGRPDMKRLSIDKEFHYDTPICRAKGIYVDEVGRGSSAIRNSLLSIMNEKKILRGNESCDTQWELFVGSTNSIPTEETGDAFWDRWVIKHRVMSATPDEMAKFIINPVSTDREISIPDETDFQSIKFADSHLTTFVTLARKNDLLTDRTISKIVDIAKCVKIIWEYDSNEEALGQTAKLICPSIADTLISSIVSPEQRAIKDKLNLLKKSTNSGRILTILTELSNLETEVCFGKPYGEQKAIREYIERGIMNSGNDVAVDKYLAKKNSTQLVDFILGA